MENAFDKEDGVNKPPGYSSSARWWTVIAGGVLALVVGILLLCWSKTTYDVLVLFLGIYLLVAGLIELSSSIMQASRKEPYGGKLAGAILAIVIGGLLLGFYGETELTVVKAIILVLLGLYLIVSGILEISAAVDTPPKESGRTLMAIVGIISVILGIIFMGFLSWEAEVDVVWIVASILLIVYGVVYAVYGIYGWKQGKDLKAKTG